MEKVVLDASIALKWFFDEADSAKALELQAKLEYKAIQVFIPQIFFFEVVNVVKTKPTSSSKDVRRAIRVIFNLPFDIQETDEKLLSKANFYAQKYDLTIYDASYLALAKSLGVSLVTVDEKLRKKVKLKFIQSLREYKV